jgi:hypothetical protein
MKGSVIENSRIPSQVEIAKNISISSPRHKSQRGLSSANLIKHGFRQDFIKLLERNGSFLPRPENHRRNWGVGGLYGSHIGNNDFGSELYVIGPSAPEILHSQNDSRITIKLFSRGRNYTDIFKQNICALGIGDGQLCEFGASLRGSGAFNSSIGLQLHLVRLCFYGTEGSPQKRYLQCANQEQKQAEEQISAIPPVSRYRHGGKFADSYGLICIFVTLLGSIPLGGFGLVWAIDGHKWSGWIAVGGALIIAILGLASMDINCLPWDWKKCLCNGQKQSKYCQESKHNPTAPMQLYTRPGVNYD